jgi:hypothetical protein
VNYMWRKLPLENFDKKGKSPEAVNGKAAAQSSGESDTAVAVPLVRTYYIQILFLSRCVCVRLFSCFFYVKGRRKVCEKRVTGSVSYRFHESFMGLMNI